MMPPPLHFCFYGTLLAGSGNAAARAAHARLRPIGRARITGTLWAIPDAAGWYPALLPGSTGMVDGMLYAAGHGFGPGDIARVDAWEDYRSDDPIGSLYLRDEMLVQLAGGTGMAAQVYRFNQPLPTAALPIVAENFSDWLIATGHAAYCG